MAKMGGKILRRELLPQFFTNSHEIWHRCLPWGVDVQDTFFDSGRKCVAMVTAYYGKNGGKILRRELLPQFFTNSHEIWHRCLPWGVDVQDTFFDSGRKCVAMVTAYYGKNWGKILRRELLPQFFTNSHEIWHRCLPWGVDVQDTFFDSGRKCVAMVTAYYGKNWGKILRRELLPQFFTNSHEIWHRCLPLGVDVQDTFFDSGRKCVAMVTAYYGKNGGKILRRELLPQFFTNSHEIWHRCLPLGVDVQDTFFDSGRKCVAMVTAYYTVKKYCGAGVLITFSDISSLMCFRSINIFYPYSFCVIRKSVRPPPSLHQRMVSVSVATNRRSRLPPPLDHASFLASTRRHT